MNIVILDADTLGEGSFENIAKLGSLSIYPMTQGDEVVERAKDAEIILTNKVILDGKILQKLPKLKLICITATGMNNVDLEMAKRLNIEVKNVANYSTQAVAQHTLMFALSLLGKQNYYERYVKNGEWAKSNIFTHICGEYELYELEGKKWGIIGFGNIGQRVGEIAKAFGANVSYYSTSGKNTIKGWDRVELLQTLLKESDIISIHAPLNEMTKNLITKKELHLLKKDAILINMGRGGIVNEADLAEVIMNKSFYFATDVLEKEPMAKNHPFLNEKLSNIFITPHIAWAYKESRARLLQGVEKNIKDFLASHK